MKVITPMPPQGPNSQTALSPEPAMAECMVSIKRGRDKRTIQH